MNIVAPSTLYYGAKHAYYIGKALYWGYNQIVNSLPIPLLYTYYIYNMYYTGSTMYENAKYSKYLIGKSYDFVMRKTPKNKNSAGKNEFKVFLIEEEEDFVIIS